MTRSCVSVVPSCCDRLLLLKARREPSPQSFASVATCGAVVSVNCVIVEEAVSKMKISELPSAFRPTWSRFEAKATSLPSSDMDGWKEPCEARCDASAARVSVNCRRAAPS